MPRTFEDDDPPESEGYEPEGYEPEYHPEAEDAGDLWCPKCSAVMYADATRCPSCGDYVTPGARPVKGHPWWIWLGLALLIAATLGMGLGLAGLLR